MICCPFPFWPLCLVYIVHTFRCSSLGTLYTFGFTYQKKLLPFSSSTVYYACAVWGSGPLGDFVRKDLSKA